MKKTLLLIISAFFAVSLIAQTVNEKAGIIDLQKLKSLENVKGLLATTQRLDSTITELWSGTAWTLSNRRRYTYSVVGSTSTVITELKGLSTGFVWQYSNKTETTVNISGNPTLIITYSWNLISSAWVGLIRTENVYTGANLTQTTSYTWSGSAWVPTSRTDLTYVGANVDTEIHSTWNGSAWVNSTRVVNTYTGGVLTSDITSDWNGSAWVNADATTYTYSGTNLATIIFKTWDVGTSAFINDSKIDYTYTTGRLTLAIFSNWVAGAWSAVNKSEYTYDGTGRLTQYIVSSSTNNGSTWTGLLRNDISYGTQGALSYTVTIGYTWDAVGSQWASQTRITNWYSDVVTGIEQVSEKTLRIYPNPAKDFVVFDLADISESASVIILNIQGKKVLEQKLSGNRQLNINSLPDGMYIFKVSNNGKTYSGKLLKN